jgi:SAM-dependent methyltransferase
MSCCGGPCGESYQFGDSALAVGRLRLLAEVFEPASRAFLGPFAALAPRDVLDLGCGPGHTTRLLAEIFPTAQVLGVDSSANFIERARLAPAERVAYAVADVTLGLPGGLYDLIYCRYLLTHLTQPQAAIQLWAGSLRSGGLLAIEENDWICTQVPAFTKYLSIVAAMLADAGQKLYIGPQLDRMDWSSLEQRSSDVEPIVVSGRAAARMFIPNLATWRDRPFVRINYSSAELDRLRRDLEQLALDESPSHSITFGRRRLVLARRR